MKKLMAMALIFMLTGCTSDTPIPKQSEQDQWVDYVYRAVTKYEIMNGTTEEQARKPITDEQVKGLQDFLNGEDTNVRDNVYKP